MTEEPVSGELAGVIRTFGRWNKRIGDRDVGVVHHSGDRAEVMLGDVEQLPDGLGPAQICFPCVRTTTRADDLRGDVFASRRGSDVFDRLAFLAAG